MLDNYIHIGTNSFLACAGGITINDFSALSPGVSIYSVTDDYLGDGLTNPTVPKEFLNVTSSPVVLNKHSLIGSGSILLPGVSIGEGASIGALSLVNKSVAAWGVYVGSPAKRLRARNKNLLKMETRLHQLENGTSS